jgi:hypothetical protein
MKLFKARPSSLGKLMSKSKKPGELSQTCITYLKEWYAGDKEELTSKYLTKGILLEDEAIKFASKVLYGGIKAYKNEDIYSNEWLVGTPDVILENSIIDTKCAWNRKTLLDSALELNTDYEWQLRGYMMLCNKEFATLFYYLGDTPAAANYGTKVSYSHLEDFERWVSYEFKRDISIEQEIIERVELCRNLASKIRCRDTGKNWNKNYNPLKKIKWQQLSTHLLM